MARKQSPIRKRDQIDNIAKYYSQPRSIAPKRPRTDFANFFGFSHSSIKEGSSPGLLPADKNETPNVSTASLEDSKDRAIKYPELPLVRCSKAKSKEFGASSSSIEVSVVEAELVSQNGVSYPQNDSNVLEQRSDAAAVLELVPKRAQVTESCSLPVAPGSIVWAKTACQMWWPAEVMDEKPTLAESGNQGINGHVLVQFYGKLQCSWVDPSTDISQLEECFDERSSNSSDGFQDALKQALQGKVRPSSFTKLSGNNEGCVRSSYQQDNSSGGHGSSISSNEVLETWRKKIGHKSKGALSLSSKPAEIVHQTRRGKRERKPKLHFDEAKHPARSKSEPRRLRIMRLLGLAPPLGSPF